MNETRQLAEYAVGLSLKEVPQEVQSFAKLLILDQIGCQLGGSHLPWCNAIYKTLRSVSASGNSSVVQRSDRASMDAATFINAAFGHSNETDDTHLKSPTHPGAVSVPSAFAVAEEMQADGKATLEAVIAAYEVQLRVSYSVSPYLLAQGHHPPPAVGPFGAAAAASHLLGFNGEQALNALGVAGSFSGGLIEYTQTGGSVKRIHCALGAHSGVRAAMLARDGLTGPPTVLEGNRGFCKVFVPKCDISWLTRDLGSRYILMETSFKPYSTCHAIHQPLDALAILLKQEKFGLKDVESMKITTRNKTNARHVGTIKEPPDILGAQFSNSYCLALYLKRGNCGFWDFREEDLKDPELLDLSRRIDTCAVDAEEDKFIMGAKLEVQLKNGHRLETQVEYSRGMPENPLTPDEVVAKFRTIVRPVLGDKVTEEVIRMVANLEQLDDIRKLTDIMREPAKTVA